MKLGLATALAAVLWIVGGGGQVQAQSASNPPMAASEAKQKLKQGKHYLRKGLIEQGIAQLEAALKLPRDRHAGPIVLALHKAYRKAGRFGDAMEVLERSADLQAAKDLRDKLTKTYGRMRFTAVRTQDAGVKGAVAIMAPGLISKEKKAVFHGAQAALAEGVQLPVRVWLPFADYRVGGRTVAHRPGKPAPDVAVMLPRIAVIAEHPRELEGPIVEALGRNVGGELRKVLAGDLRSKAKAKALIKWSPELVITLGAGSTQISRMILPTSPTVFAGVPKDMWKRMMRRDRKGLTGVATEAPWPVVARLFRSVVPEVRRVGIVVRTRSKATAEYATAALKRLGVETVVEHVRHAEQARTALARVARGADALWALPDTGLWNLDNRKVFRDICRNRGAACLGPDDQLVEEGVLMAVSSPDEVLGARLAFLARAIVRDGKRPEELPIAPPTGYAFVLNVRTAEALGLTLSEETRRSAARLHGRSAAAAATTR